MEEQTETKKEESQIYALRTTANREDQVVDFVVSNVLKKKLNVYSILRPHGMRGYVFVEAGDRGSAEEAFQGVPYAKSLLDKTVRYEEIEPMIEQSKAVVNIQKNDIVEMISEPFKKEKAKVVRLDKVKGEVVVSLLNAAVPIPVTVKLDNVRVIRRDEMED